MVSSRSSEPVHRGICDQTSNASDAVSAAGKVFSLICIARYYELLITKALTCGICQQFCLPSTFIHKWNKPYMLYTCFYSGHRASPHFGWYSFSVSLRVGGWQTADAGDGQCQRSGCSIPSCTVELYVADTDGHLHTLCTLLAEEHPPVQLSVQMKQAILVGVADNASSDIHGGVHRVTQTNSPVVRVNQKDTKYFTK